MNPFFFAWIAWLAIMLLVQGIHVLTVGTARVFFLPNAHLARLPMARRLQNGFVTMACSLLPLFITVRILLQARLHITPGDVMSASAFCVPGIWFMLAPTTPIKWARYDHPDVPLDNPYGLWIARICGAFFLFGGLLCVAPWQ